jgi:hypothetical protein
MNVEKKKQMFRVPAPGSPVHQHVQERDQGQKDEHGLGAGTDNQVEKVCAIVSRDFAAGVLEMS